TALEVGVGGSEGGLDSVLGLLLGAEHVPAETEDRTAVTLERDLERSLAAALDLLDQMVVPGEPEQPARRTEAKARLDVGSCRTTHENAVGSQRFAHNSRTSRLGTR